MNSIVRAYFVADELPASNILSKMLNLITRKEITLEKEGNAYRIGEVSVKDFTKIAASTKTLANDLDIFDLELIVVPFYDIKLISGIKKNKTGVYFLYDLLLEKYNSNKLDIKNITSILKDVPTEILLTVKNYIRLNQSLVETGELMFEHRNTINYRINKFISLTSINVREMQNAVLVYFIITLMDINEELLRG